MKQRLDKLSESAKTLISTYLAKDDIDSVRQLSELAARIKSIHQKLASLENEVEIVDGILKGFSTLQPIPTATKSHASPDEIDLDFDVPGRSPAKKLRIEIDWRRAGKPWDTEIFSDNKASVTMAKFIERLCKIYGQDAIEKLAKARVNRGPLITKNPRQDFLNRSTGGLYGHQHIPSVGFWVLTHSSTSQKVTDLREVCRSVGLPAGMVKITEVDK